MAKKKKQLTNKDEVNKIMGIIGGIILFLFIIVMVVLNIGPDLSAKVTLPSGFDKVKNVLVEFDIKDRGKVQLELRNDLMPRTVKNFVQNILNKSYDNLEFYRVDNYLVLTGFNQEGMKLELNNELKPDKYALCMAKEADGNLSSKSIFFIMKAKDESFYGKYAIFGRVANVDSENVVDKIQLNDLITTARLVELDGEPYVAPEQD